MPLQLIISFVIDSALSSLGDSSYTAGSSDGSTQPLDGSVRKQDD
jgi:hypothetical protein